MQSSTRAFIILMAIVLVAVGLAIFFSGGPAVDEPSTPDGPSGKTPREGTEPGEAPPDEPPKIPDRTPAAGRS